MYKVLVLAVALAVCVSAAPADDKKEVCAGCPHEQVVNEEEILPTINAIRSQENSVGTVKRIISHTTQVVAGTKNMIKYETSEGEICNLSYVIRIWISKLPENVKHECTKP